MTLTFDFSLKIFEMKTVHPLLMPY